MFDIYFSNIVYDETLNGWLTNNGSQRYFIIEDLKQLTYKYYIFNWDDSAGDVVKKFAYWWQVIDFLSKD